MRNCPRCGLDGDEASFFPEGSTQKWCRLCVEEHVRLRQKDRTKRLEKQEREQKAIRELVEKLQEDRPMVYLIEGPGGYKIGFSTNVSKRACQLNTSFAETCKLIAIAPGSRDLERSLHHKHRFKRLNREWFAQSPSILRDFEKLTGSYILLKGYMNADAQREQAQ